MIDQIEIRITIRIGIPHAIRIYYGTYYYYIQYTCICEYILYTNNNTKNLELGFRVRFTSDMINLITF